MQPVASIEEHLRFLKKYNLFLLFITVFFHFSFGQTDRAAQYIIDLGNANDDSTRFQLLFKLGQEFSYSKPLVALDYFQQAEQLATKNSFSDGLSNVYGEMGGMYADLGQNTMGIEFLLKSYKIKEQLNDSIGMAGYQNNVAIVFDNLGNFNLAIEHYQKALHIDSSLGRPASQVKEIANIGYSYLQINDTAKAQHYLDRAMQLYNSIQTNLNIDFIYDSFGSLERLKGNYPASFRFYFKGLQLARDDYDLITQQYILKNIAHNFENLGQIDSAIRYYTLSMQIGQRLGAYDMLDDTYRELCRIHLSLGDTENFRKFYQRLMVVSDSLSIQERERQLMHAESILQIDRKTTEIAELGEQQKRQRQAGWFLIVTIGLLVVVAFLFFRGYRNESKHNTELASKNKQIREEKEKVEKAADKLHRTQKQLIAKEKLAAMGKLTTWVAHELRNPLNFVHNFSEILLEQSAELEQKIKSYSEEQAEKSRANELIDDMKASALKIAEHSQRADIIIAKMLQHASVNPGKQEVLNIIPVLEETYRVALHSFQSQYPEFSVKTGWRLPEEGYPISLNAAALSRALFNIFDNAFFAMNQKLAGGDKPKLSISLEKEESACIISIRDNGTGMTPSVQEQVLEPFFTTKPAGKGNTGLGMSIAYEIIAKEHGGTLTVEAEEGKFTNVSIGLQSAEEGK